MKDPSREAFESAAEEVGFRTQRINGEYIMLTKRAWKLWQAAVKWERQRQRGAASEGLQQERPGV